MKLRGIFVLLFFGAYLFMIFYVMPNASERLVNASSQDTAIDVKYKGPLDLQQGYDTLTVRKTFEWMGENGRETYRVIESRDDIAYPLVYGIFWAMVIAFFAPKAFPKLKKLQLLALLPLIAVIFDFAENMFILSMLKLYPTINPGMVKIASMMTGLKWGFALPALAAIFIFVLVYLFKRFVFRRRTTQTGSPAKD